MRTNSRESVKDFYGKIIGWIETNTNTGEAQAKDFYGKIIGWYDPNYGKSKGKNGCTRDFYGRIIGYGNQLSGIVWNPKYNKCLKK